MLLTPPIRRMIRKFGPICLLYGASETSYFSGFVQQKERKAAAFCHRTLCVQFRILHAVGRRREKRFGDAYVPTAARTRVTFTRHVRSGGALLEEIGGFWHPNVQVEFAPRRLDAPFIYFRWKKAISISPFGALKIYDPHKNPGASQGAKWPEQFGLMTNRPRLQTWLVKMSLRAVFVSATVQTEGHRG